MEPDERSGDPISLQQGQRTGTEEGKQTGPAKRAGAAGGSQCPAGRRRIASDLAEGLLSADGKAQ